MTFYRIPNNSSKKLWKLTNELNKVAGYEGQHTEKWAEFIYTNKALSEKEIKKVPVSLFRIESKNKKT